MADVSVDTETGVVRMNKIVCVQDCGTVIELQTAESQVYGALIMGIAYSLTEERIMDRVTGQYINADMENYKLPHIGDVGQLIVEMYQPDDQYNRGVVGLGEPPVISTGAAISNAVANAIGVRVPVLPLTPQRVLEAPKGAQNMKSFEYATPRTETEALGFLNEHGSNGNGSHHSGGAAAVLAGGNDLVSLMQRELLAPQRVVDLKNIASMSGIEETADGVVVGSLTTLEEMATSSLLSPYRSVRQVIDATHSIQIQSRGTLGGDLCHLPNCWYYRNGYGLLALKDGRSLVEAGDNRYHAILGNTGLRNS